jgi:Flp pilus assembly pilin Flp
MKPLKQSKKAGLALAEQGMVVAFVAIVAIAVVKSVSNKAANTYDNVQVQMMAQCVDSAAPQPPAGAASGSPADSSGSSNSGSSAGSDDSSKQDRDNSNNGHHYGQIRNGNNGKNGS